MHIEKLLTLNVLSLRPLGGVVMLALTLGLVACSSQPTRRAPVEDRSVGVRAPSDNSAPTPVTAVKSLPGAENAGKPGYYTVKPGDTLIRIGLEHGQTWKDIARWNGLDNANLIEVGKALKQAA